MDNQNKIEELVEEAADRINKKVYKVDYNLPYNDILNLRRRIFIEEISTLLKSQAEKLEGLYGFSSDDWEKKKQELLQSQRDSRDKELREKIERNEVCFDPETYKFILSLLKEDIKN